ncbi:MAG: Smr/MutS family protein, partial [Deltaproteobacteria bacterium]|nr:Smr/MutS family protein [Deltaproteobacteria bacterium]
VGLDPRVCDKAEENFKTSAGPLGRALQALEARQAEADQSRRALEEERQTLASQSEKLAREREAVHERERAIEAEARVELVAEVERVRGEVSRILAGLQAAPSGRAAVDAQSQLAKLARTEEKKLAVETAAAQTAPERLPEGAAIAVGMRVRVPTLGDAQVLEVSGDEAVVQAGALKVRRKLKDLVALKGQAKTARLGGKKGEKLKLAEQAAPQALDFGSHRIDVRGMRAEDALRAVETFLDRSYGEGKPGAAVHHGLGTGALKATLREYLKGSPYVRSFRSGAEHEGGEGVTVVEFKG